jgi:hypothetical protein
MTFPRTAVTAILLGLGLGCSPGKSPEAARTPPKPDPADNSRCYACHEAYQDDMLTQVHAKSGVGCGECHGRSKPHEDDKSSRVPPDVMFAADTMPVFCATCHPTHDAPAVKVIRQWQKRCAGKSKPEEASCTDCHGTHRMKSRTIRWDKKTRERIPSGAK